MQLGITMFGDSRFNLLTNEIQSPEIRMKEIIEEIKLMDEVGLDYFGIGEHHRADYVVAAPEIILAAAATQTKHIILGSSVSVISSADPVKLFQDFAMIDLLSDGRAEIMAGRGSFIESFPLFGYDLNQYDEVFEEKLDLLLKINTNNPVSWKGKFRPELKDQDIYPRPKHGKLPVWIAVGGTPQSVERAARLGLPVMFAIIGGNYTNFKALFDYYQQAYQAYGHDMQNFEVGVHMHAFFVEDQNQLMQLHYPTYAAQMNRIGATRGWPNYKPEQYEQGRSQAGHLIVGDAPYATDKIIEVIETFGLTRFAAHLDTGAMEHKHMMKAIEIYGTKIAPEVRKAVNKAD
ncbi:MULTISPECIES: LLM class flavin-dependent oxidoreductase [unclassified Acinetobacter]|uniref:LLM class flavin-dependent oxidoreductase n=1 Tax=unclassified Acinetobacter TaxID=196816 RepID=UPI0019096020|nr:MULTISPECIES: LLM class flavin-dependent oxidoreductase [unclassified Acinetobacter]MBK0064035.1 LLM class flavin-dependent oxidoreductase [Acinetobacter sp. S55]MBK0067456.1 LLM class flavin-dependent oxidoreductase [Acinetobacter sp. S54]